jgi:type II secretion system protein C
MNHQIQKWINSLIDLLKISGEFKESLLALGSSVFFTISFSYFLATGINSLFVPFLMAPILQGRGVIEPSLLQSGPNLLGGQTNFRDLKKTITDRNLFNIEGLFPDEKDQTQDFVQMASSIKIEERGPCELSRLPLSLIGTLYLGANNENSMVTIIEKGQEEADTYRVGDDVLGQEDVSISQIFPNRVVLSRQGKLECLELVGALEPIVKAPDRLGQGVASTAPAVLSSAWVESQIGEGYSKIITEINLIPHVGPDGSIKGYKISGIAKGSLMDKAGFQDGDVVTKVNDHLLNEQAFSLYEAFLNEKSITIQLLRQEEIPTTIMVQIQ